ncbi:hypothetical protein ACGFX4_14855 [Kitasatospora sp. NPDC048365]|uniref:hypothetical protein n=1 Tax=Kitasatospora sp. NPDC048365 TaxID=3364050 RepID=UPI003722ED4C
MTENRGVSAVLRLYPAAYRGERGAELAGVHEELMAGAGRWERLRGLGDLAGYGLRLRFGLGAAGLLARLLAVAAPFAAGALLGRALFTVEDIVLVGRVLRHYAVFGDGSLPSLLDRAGTAVLALAAVAALFGRWAAARAAAWVGVVLAVVSGAGMCVADAHLRGGAEALLGAVTVGGPQLLWALMLLAAPRDLLPPVSWRSVAALCAGALMAGPMLYGAFYGLLGWGTLFAADWMLPLGPALVAGELVLLVAAVPALLRGRLLPAAWLVATLPMMLPGVVPYAVRTGLGPTGVLVLLSVVAAGAVLLGRYWHPVVPRRGAPRV